MPEEDFRPKIWTNEEIEGLWKYIQTHEPDLEQHLMQLTRVEIEQLSHRDMHLFLQIC
jgi:hypothetical protein